MPWIALIQGLRILKNAFPHNPRHFMPIRICYNPYSDAETGSTKSVETQMMDGFDTPMESISEENESGDPSLPNGEAPSTDSADHPNDDAGDVIHPQRVVEALLMACDTPITAAKIASIVETCTAREVRVHIETLNRQYEEGRMSFRIEHIAEGYQILTLPAYNTWLSKLLHTRQETRLSPAAMETLAIIAYKQPCTRADIEAIRGVAAGDMLSRLREMNLVKIVGRAEDLGRPMLYGTTKQFLKAFGLPSLEELPQVEAFKASAVGMETNLPAGPTDLTVAGEDRNETLPADPETSSMEASHGEAIEDDPEMNQQLDSPLDEASCPPLTDDGPNLTVVREDDTETTT